jgi:hypothetical protein
MNTTLRPCLIFVLCLSATSGMASPCPPATSISVAISPTYTFGGTSSAAVIYPDSAAAYIDGVNGVSAIINGCTHDAVIDLSNSTRTVGLSLQTAVATNGYTPSWTAAAFMAKAHLVVSNLLYGYSAGSYYTFTTIANIAFTAPDGSSDQLQFVNPTAQASSVQGGLVNQPYYTSLVVVTHSPADPNTGAVETWTVTPDNTNMNSAGTPAATQVAGLLISQKHGSVNGGQFSMPFQFVITRK